jgi:TRAP-type C4-dicarboxylate transport system permease small subunit
VGVLYKCFRKGGKMRKALEILTDVTTLLCGFFMFYIGLDRVIRLMGMSGVMPGTGLNTAWQYLPIPLAGLVMTFDSILFLLGILRPDDLLYSEPEVDYSEMVIRESKQKEGVPS